MSDYDVVVIGSGFGGSVAALRLAEKGYRVAVLEAGRRFADDEFPKTSWDTKRFLWAPALGWYGLQRISLLRNVLVLSGAGVGGGSLVYANTLYRARPAFYALAPGGWRDVVGRPAAEPGLISRGPAAGPEFASRLPSAGTAGGVAGAAGMPFLGGMGVGAGSQAGEHRNTYWVRSAEPFDVPLPPHVDAVLQGGEA